MKMKITKSALLLMQLTFLALLSKPDSMLGQTIIPPGIPSTQLTGADPMASVRTAMIDFPSTDGSSIYQVSAIVVKWDNSGTVELFVESTAGIPLGATPIQAPITGNYSGVGYYTGGSHTTSPDVIIANDEQRQDAFIVIVAYTEWNGSDWEVYLTRYQAQLDAMEQVVALNHLSTEFVDYGYDPSIDVLADISQMIPFPGDDRPVMNEFVLAYNRFGLPDMVITRCRVADPISSASSASYPANSVQDICAVNYLDIGEPFAYAVFYDANFPPDIIVKEIHLNSWSDNDFPLTPSDDYSRFRIEGYSVGEYWGPNPKWAITGSHNSTAIHTYTDNGSFFDNTVNFSTDLNLDADVTAGLGNYFPGSSGDWGNNQFTFAWHRVNYPGYTNPGFFANYMDNSPNMSTASYEQINNMPTITYNDRVPCVSVSNSCNGGDNMITAYNQGYDIYYKYSGPGYGFGPAKIERTSPDAVSVRIYPNPVSEVLNIENMSGYEAVSIYNAQGQEVYQAATGWENESSVDVSGLPSGNYTIFFSCKEWRSGQAFTIVR